MSCPGSFVCKTSVGISDKSSLRSNITFHSRPLRIFRGGLFLTKKCYPQKIGVLRICKLPSLMCSMPQLENSLIAQDPFYGSTSKLTF